MKRILLSSILAGGLIAGCTGADDSQSNQNQGRCGDGLQSSGEECDNGSANSDSDPDACRSDCRLAHCGDYVIDTLEECDEGLTNSDLIPGACRTDCRLAHCGDGVTDPGETCDDENTDPGDGCSDTCQVEPHFSCTGQPSACSCVEYHHGDHCERCMVYVDHAAPVDPADGRGWSTAYQEIQDGIDAAAGAGPDCEVWVAQGTYEIFDYSPLNTLSLRSRVAVYGGFAGSETARDDRDWTLYETVLEGRQQGTTRAVNHVVSAVATEDATLDGFVITGGYANGEFADRLGAGLYAYGSSLTVAHCVFRGNVALDFGGGVYAYGSRLAMEATIFADNEADTGGGVSSKASLLTVTSCVFNGNLADEGAGIAVLQESDLQLVSSTLARNAATTSGGGLLVDSAATATATAVGSIIWGNQAPQGRSIQGTLAATYCDIQGPMLQPGTGNLNVSPQFTSPDDLRLLPGSPCIDVGDDNSAPPRDMDGNPRVDVTGVGTPGTLADLGAYEYQP